MLKKKSDCIKKIILNKNRHFGCFDYLLFLEISGAKLNGNFFFLLPKLIFQITRLSLHLKHFLVIVVPGIVEFIQENLTYFEKKVTKQGLPP